MTLLAEVLSIWCSHLYWKLWSFHVDQTKHDHPVFKHIVGEVSWHCFPSWHWKMVKNLESRLDTEELDLEDWHLFGYALLRSPVMFSRTGSLHTLACVWQEGWKMCMRFSFLAISAVGNYCVTHISVVKHWRRKYIWKKASCSLWTNCIWPTFPSNSFEVS